MGLLSRLEDYANHEPARFHMPGHKGRLEGFDIYGVDVTEVLDFDDLHSSNGLIHDINREFADLYSAERARLIVNGTTAGIMAGIFSMIKEGDRVLVPRNSHKSVYNALMLRKAKCVYVYQRMDQKGIPSPIKLKDVELSLKVYSDIKLAILTYPTYEGVCSEINDICTVLHRNNISVLCDGAHGAHLGIFDNEEEIHPINMGPDIVITSIHKTLPFLTQTSLALFSNSGLRYYERFLQYMDCFESSSPSYVLMAGADRGLKFLKEKGRTLNLELKKNLKDFEDRCQRLKNIYLVEKDSKDPGKILITTDISGGCMEIDRVLKEQNVVCEMAQEGYILAMASIMNTKEDFDRLYKALSLSDSALNKLEKPEGFLKKPVSMPVPASEVMSMSDALSKEIKFVSLDKAKGKVSGGFIEMFPPGVPLIVPGERIDKETIDLIKNARDNNINIRGVTAGKVPVV